MQSDVPHLDDDAATVAAKARRLRALMLETGLTFQELADTVQLSEQDLINLLSAGHAEIRDLSSPSLSGPTVARPPSDDVAFNNVASKESDEDEHADSE